MKELHSYHLCELNPIHPATDDVKTHFKMQYTAVQSDLKRDYLILGCSFHWHFDFPEFLLNFRLIVIKPDQLAVPKCPVHTVVTHFSICNTLRLYAHHCTPYISISTWIFHIQSPRKYLPHWDSFVLAIYQQLSILEEDLLFIFFLLLLKWPTTFSALSFCINYKIYTLWFLFFPPIPKQKFSSALTN